MAPAAIISNDAATDSVPVPLCQIVTPVGMLGYGFSEDLTAAALEEFSDRSSPTALVLDSGSTDSGPSKLALGSMTCPRASYVRDLRKLLQLSTRCGVPVLISSAGGDGSDEHVDTLIEIVREIAESEENKLGAIKALAIYSGVPKTTVLDRFEEIVGCGPSVPPLTVEAIHQAPRIVAQMGPEPFLEAISAHPDFNIVIGGRAYDVAPFVAFAAFHALRSKQNSLTALGPDALGCFTHMGKILECGGLCATPKSQGALGIINRDWSFDIKPLDPGARCTPLTVAAHTLYEKTRPDILHGPGGYLDVSRSTYTQLDDAIGVRVQGSIFHTSKMSNVPYTVKLEGARVAGFRTLIIGSFRDPILIPQTYAFLDKIKEQVRLQHSDVTERWDISFHVSGVDKDGPMANVPREVFIVGECIAETQALATSVASTARVNCAHASYPGQKATSGTFAMGIGGKLELETGECAEFCIYHLMPLKEGEEGAREVGSHDSGTGNGLFRFKFVILGQGSAAYATEKLGSIRPKTIKDRPKKVYTSKIAANLDNPERLVDIAQIIRSKNSGPFEITLDIMFDNRIVYKLVKESGLLDGHTIANLFQLTPEEIIWAGWFDQALAFKATIPRKRNGKPAISGGYLEDDVHGSQQYIPLLDLKLTEELARDLRALKI